jgi:glutathione S-transferase
VTATPEIISAQVCPFAQRSRMALLEKGVDFDLTEIDLRNKPDWFLKVSPYGKVPVLRHDGNVVYESAVINEYIEEVFPDPPLMPRDPARRAQARIWIDHCNTRFVPTFYKLLLAQDADRRDELRDKLEAELRFMERHGLDKMSGDGPFWMGANVSLVDLTYYPFFERFVVASHYRGAKIPSDCPRLRAWLDAVKERDSARDTGNPPDYYIPRYAKYADGSARGVTAREMQDA